MEFQDLDEFNLSNHFNSAKKGNSDKVFKKFQPPSKIMI